jgi:hypothetical protein
VLLLQAPALVLAQQASSDDTNEWRTLDADLRQAVIDEIVARRGLSGNIENADELITSADDIREALRISCDFSGACGEPGGQARLGEQVKTFPDYDEQEGLRNAEFILNLKSVTR